MQITTVVPDEIIMEILSNLPPKSLFKLKSVSKSWRSLISSPHFIKKHLNKQLLSGRQKLKLMLTFDESPPRRLYYINSCSLASLSHNNNNNYNHYSRVAMLEHPMVSTPIIDTPWSRKPIEIHGSCNGLILIIVGSFMFLWNPSTRKSKNIPHPCKIGDFHDPMKITILYGLGYDESADDYRVVCSYNSNRHQILVGPYETEIYSLRSGAWKKADTIQMGVPGWAEYSGRFVGGRLHWLGGRYYEEEGGSYGCDIVSIDLAEGRCELVAMPDCLRHCHRVFPDSLKVLGGNLGLVCYVDNDCDMHIWVMKEYGVKESWVRVLTILLNCGVSNMLSNREEKRWYIGSLLWSPKKGDGVLAYGPGATNFRPVFGPTCTNLVFCDGRDDELRRIEVDLVDRIVEANVYVETLVSPFGDDDAGYVL
ncbi:hypothetical protein ACP275_04G108400 [Erythranthe tilingii]